LLGCSENPGGTSGCSTCSLPAGLNISNAISAPVLAPLARSGASLDAVNGGDVTYVSLDPGTAPAGQRAIVHRVGDPNSVNILAADGGFDPVAVVAQTGDSIDVRVLDASGATVYHAVAAVPATRPPVVVRTDPPPRRRDVPLNASLVVIFSEPIDSTTLTTSSVQLLKGTTAVPGSVRFIDADDIEAIFEPATALESSSDYQLVVTTGLRDRDGQPLDSEVVVDFTTGTASLAGVASVGIVADTFATFPSVGSSWQLVAVARDSNNAIIVGRPVTWVSNNVAVATVSSTGLLRAVAVGRAQIVATVEGVASPPRFIQVE